MAITIESLRLFWKELWTLKDNKEAPPVMDRYWKSSITVMCDQNATHLFKPSANMVASLFVPMLDVRVNYRRGYPLAPTHGVEIEYLRLKHWLLKMTLPLDQSLKRTVGLSVVPRWYALSFPCEITLKRNENDNRMSTNWSVGVTREAPTVSFIFKLFQLNDDGISASASCKLKSPHLSISTSWKKKELKCSLEHKDGDLTYISIGDLNFKNPEKSMCSVGLRKKIDESKGIQVAYDTNQTSTISFSYRVDKKFKFEVSAKVDSRDINHSQISASCTYQ